MPVAAILAGAVHQPLDLALGEVAPFDCQFWAFGTEFWDADFIAIKLPCSQLSDELI
jgi:hypothetical protein